ncbi:hypothetical protein B0I27_103135 [Arcticibacter pallidicorallinus]|uniref:Oligosaccharide repeat unit polymerase n=1 Tax=Arcticibacter pallidicorallinus TaxID=1259464 RepID=A0A2T0U6X4_9SPHI|nr:hypothetical protein [Arcticibacter pallidicorallinus]PRY53665.1 hypothetical protein B0I27_103135 [Arcticibacter pallidicorallinus]
MLKVFKLCVLVNAIAAITLFFLTGSRDYLIWTLLGTNILAVLVCRNMQLLLVAVLYIFTYNFHYYLEFTGAQLSPYTEFQNAYYYGVGASVNLVVLVSFILFVNVMINSGAIKRGVFTSLKSKLSSNTLYLINTIVCALIICFLTTRGSNLFFAIGNLYELYRDNLDAIGGIGVYFSIFFFAMFVFKPEKTSSLPVHLIFFSFLLYALSRGTRMLIVPPLLMYFFYFFENRFSWKWIICFAALGMFVLTAIDRFKNGLGIFEDNTAGSNILINNQAEILYGANGTIFLIQNEVVPVLARLKLSFGLFFTSFIPPGLFDESWKYPHFTGIYNVSAGGGGLASIGIYAMLSWAGPALLGAYLALIGNYLYSSSRKSLYYCVWFTISLFMVTRWYTYDLNVLFRLPFYSIVVIVFYVLILKKSSTKL